jgi:methyl-accepting chemotaxis protein
MNSIASAVEEQTAATQEITRNVQQAASGMRNVSMSIAGVSEAVDKAGAPPLRSSTPPTAWPPKPPPLRREVEQFLQRLSAA